MEADEKPPPLSHLPVAYPRAISSSSYSVLSKPSASHPWLACGSITCLLLGLLLVLLAAFVPLYGANALRSYIHANFVILSSPSSPSFPSFQSSNPLTLSVYLFNLTNPAATLAGARPVLAEVGPFVFLNTRVKTDIAWSADASTLSYREWQSFAFQPPPSSCCPLTTPITTLNMLTHVMYYEGVAAALAGQLPLSYVLLRDYADELNHSVSALLLTTRPASDLISGYSLTVASANTSVWFPGFFPNQTAAQASNVSTILTGVDDPSDAHRLLAWHGQSTVYTCTGAEEYCAVNRTVWATAAASAVSGTDGAAFPTPLDASSTPRLWFPPLQRAVELQWMGDGEYKGIDCALYGLPDAMWRNVTWEAGNAAYYQTSIDGALNTTSLSGFVPTFLTTPRFASIPASSPYSPNVTLLLSPSAPSPSSIPTSFAVQPSTGLTVSFATSSQVNVLMAPLNFSVLHDDATVWGAALSPRLLPLFWAWETGGLSDEQADTVTAVVIVQSSVQWLAYVLGALAGTTLLLTLCCGVRWRRKTRVAAPAAAVRDGAGEKARLKTGLSGARVWYGQAPSDPTEQDDEDETSLEAADDAEVEESRIRLGYRY